MDRREPLYHFRAGDGLDPNLIRTQVSFLHHKDDARRKKGQLRQLESEEKMLCALRKVLAKMSADSDGERRHFIASSACRILDRHVAPGARSGDPGTYQFRGRCKIGILHQAGHVSDKMIEFRISFRDTEDAMGLPDVEYIEPTTLDEIDPRTEI